MNGDAVLAHIGALANGSVKKEDWVFLWEQRGLLLTGECSACGRPIQNVVVIARRTDRSTQAHLGLTCFALLEKTWLGEPLCDSEFVNQALRADFNRTLTGWYEKYQSRADDFDHGSWARWIIRQVKNPAARVPELVVRGARELDRYHFILDPKVLRACIEFFNDNRLFPAEIVLGPHCAELGVSRAQLLTVSQALRLRRSREPVWVALQQAEDLRRAQQAALTPSSPAASPPAAAVGRANVEAPPARPAEKSVGQAPVSRPVGQGIPLLKEPFGSKLANRLAGRATQGADLAEDWAKWLLKHVLADNNKVPSKVRAGSEMLSRHGEIFREDLLEHCLSFVQTHRRHTPGNIPTAPVPQASANSRRNARRKRRRSTSTRPFMSTAPIACSRCGETVPEKDYLEHRERFCPAHPDRLRAGPETD